MQTYIWPLIFFLDVARLQTLPCIPLCMLSYASAHDCKDVDGCVLDPRGLYIASFLPWSVSITALYKIWPQPSPSSVLLTSKQLALCSLSLSLPSSLLNLYRRRRHFRGGHSNCHQLCQHYHCHQLCQNYHSYNHFRSQYRRYRRSGILTADS